MELTTPIYERCRRVTRALEQCGGQVSFDALMETTTLSAAELYTTIGVLSREKQMPITINVKMEERRQYETRSEALLAEFLDLLAVYSSRERRVSFYASKLFLTPKYFATVIKNASGRHPSDWIRDSVIKRVEYQLRCTNLSVKEIASAVNFTNLSFFGRYFKESMGVSPLAYRAACRKNKL